jgi:hypothetical protein
MRNEKHYRNLLRSNPSAAVGFTLAASAVYAARYGACEAEHHGTDEWKQIARQLKSDYGEQLTADEARAEMDSERTTRDNIVSIRLNNAELESLDEKRGDAERSDYIRKKLGL